MIIRFPDFRTTLVYDTTNFVGNTDQILSEILKETLCRLPYSSLDHKQICKIKYIIEHSYSDYIESQ